MPGNSFVFLFFFPLGCIDHEQYAEAEERSNLNYVSLAYMYTTDQKQLMR